MHPLLAFVCFFRILFGRKLPAEAVKYLPEDALPKALPAPAPVAKAADKPVEKVVEKEKEKPKPVATAQHHRDGALALLALLQREGRLVDFLRDSIEGASDADIGAAAREVHRGCKKVLDQHLSFEPVMPGEEEAKVIGAQGLRSRGDPADRRGQGRAAVPRHASPPRLARGRREAPHAGRGHRSHGDRARRKSSSAHEDPRNRSRNHELGDRGRGRRARPARSPITQVVGPGEVAERPTLPSFLLLPSEHEVPPAQLQLPWSGPLRYAVGTFARERGGGAAASPGVERRSRGCAIRRSIAPRRCCRSGAQRELDEEMEGGERVSPVDASARYLAHLRAAWDDAHPDEPADEQDVLVTVPASFDAVARELTVVAAREAGLRQGHAARGAAGRVLRVPRRARRGVAQGPRRRATSCSCATSAAAPPTSR